MTTHAGDFPGALVAPGRAADIPGSADLYGWLVGGWRLDVLRYRGEVPDGKLEAEAHFAWVLEGRAVQDVWIMPRRPQRSGPRPLGTYGTTLRLWDPGRQAWRITWVNAATGARDELVGRRHGADIVQIGTHADGTPIRWTFSEITATTFRWTGEALAPDGWRLETEFRARSR